MHGGHRVERRRGRFATLVSEPPAALELGLDRLDSRGALGMLGRAVGPVADHGGLSLPATDAQRGDTAVQALALHLV